MDFRKRHIIKPPKPFRKPKCKNYYIKVTGVDGKRCEKNLRTSDKKEARLRSRREAELVNGQLDGNFADIVTIKRIIDDYFQSKTNLADSTRKRNMQHVSFFLTFMKMRHSEIKYFNQVNQNHIGQFQGYRLSETFNRGKKISSKTARESMYVLNNIFEWAIKNDYIESNPVKKIEIIEAPPRDQHVFLEQEILLILSYCRDNVKHRYLYAPFLTLATTGLRSGELLNLTWNDIDFERQVIKIRTKTLPNGKEWTTKTKQSRELQMDEELSSILMDLKKSSESAWVFVNTKGSRQTGAMLWSNLRSLCDRLGIKRGQVHSFRRNFASMMDQTVHDRVAIQMTLGHETLTMTERYCKYRRQEYVDKAQIKTSTKFMEKLNAVEQMSK